MPMGPVDAGSYILFMKVSANPYGYGLLSLVKVDGPGHYTLKEQIINSPFRVHFYVMQRALSSK
jgi:hypothetical protein